MIQLTSEQVKHLSVYGPLYTTASTGVTYKLGRWNPRVSKSKEAPEKVYNIIDNVIFRPCLHNLSYHTVVSKKPFSNFLCSHDDQ